MTTSELSPQEHDPYYGRYLAKLPTSLDLIEGFEKGRDTVETFFQSIPEDKLLHRYQEDKWTIKEVLQHLIDTERIFMYRCFRIARRDTTSLAGFNQEIYMEPSGANGKSREQLLSEYVAGRAQSLAILRSLTAADLAFIGVANQGAMSARAAAFTIIGHDVWHMEIINERYL